MNHKHHKHHSMKDIDLYFSLPIKYNKAKQLVSDNIKTDLELIEVHDNPSLYDSIFTTKNEFSCATAKLWNEYYTCDKKFIKDTQKLVDSHDTYVIQTLPCWNKIKGDNDFTERFHFIQNKYFRFLNNHSLFLQLSSLYKFASPIVTLVYPVVVLFLPLLFLRFYNKVPITVNQYYMILKMFMMNNSLVKLFTQFSLQNWRQSFYLLFSAVMYVLSIYQNIISCITFYRNMCHTNSNLRSCCQYMSCQIDNMNKFQKKCRNLSTYRPFLDQMEVHKQVFISHLSEFQKITEYSWNLHNLSHMGYSMKLLYFFYFDKSFHDAIMYSFGFNGYLQNIMDIQQNVVNKFISPVRFGKVTKFQNAFHPTFKNMKHKKNSYSLSKSLVISGPNASGKTTLIKTTLFNILLSQQIGFGFFSKATLNPYTHIHSYLNIPDTSDRDSLFQAEARRCREIIESIEQNKDDRHFCIFDELYSGTNPYEANASAYGFIKFMLKQNMDFMLTTHFVDLCERLNDAKGLKNCHMRTTGDKNNIHYTYELDEGISTFRGGIYVLKQLKYPEKIIRDAVRYLHE